MNYRNQWAYNYCPKYKELIDLYVRIQSEVLKLQFKDEMLYGQLKEDEYYFNQVDYLVKEIKDIKSSDIEDCIDNINIFKSFEKYDYW